MHTVLSKNAESLRCQLEELVAARSIILKADAHWRIRTFWTRWSRV